MSIRLVTESNAFTGTNSTNTIDRDITNGRLWMLFARPQSSSGHYLVAFYSDDNGKTWVNSLLINPSSDFAPAAIYDLSLFVDQFGNLHCYWLSGNPLPYTPHYRFVKKTGPNSYSLGPWVELGPASNDYHSFGSVVAFQAPHQSGTDVTAFVAHPLITLDQFGVHQQKTNIDQISITNSGGTASPVRIFALSRAYNAITQPALAIQHGGNGKTIDATKPYVFMLSNGFTAEGYHQTLRKLEPSAGDPGRYYNSVAWDLVDAAPDTYGPRAIMDDGIRPVMAYKAVGSNAILVREVHPTTHVTTLSITSTPPATPLGIALLYDSKKSIIVAVRTENGIYTNRYDRVASQWTGWINEEGGMNSDGLWGYRIVSHADGSTGTGHVAFASTTPSPGGVNYLSLDLNNPPRMPILVGPTSDVYLNLAAGGTEFRWTFSDPDLFDTQSAWAFKRKVGSGASQWWSQVLGDWSSSEVWNSGDANTLVFPAGRWSNGGTLYDWAVATKDSSGDAGPYSGWQRVIGSTPPVADVVAPADPVDNTTKPIVRMTYSDPDNVRTQSGYEIRVFREAVYSQGNFNPASSSAVWQTGFVTTGVDAEVTSPVSLTNGETYRAYGRVYKANQPSEWDWREFTVNLAVPADPSSVSVQPITSSDGLAGMRITVVGGHVNSQFPGASVVVERQRQDDPVDLWTQVADMLYPSNLTVVLDDYTPAPGTPYRYRAYTKAEVV